MKGALKLAGQLVLYLLSFLVFMLAFGHSSHTFLPLTAEEQRAIPEKQKIAIEKFASSSRGRAAEISSCLNEKLTDKALIRLARRHLHEWQVSWEEEEIKKRDAGKWPCSLLHQLITPFDETSCYFEEMPSFILQKGRPAASYTAYDCKDADCAVSLSSARFLYEDAAVEEALTRCSLPTALPEDFPQSVLVEEVVSATRFKAVIDRVSAEILRIEGPARKSLETAAKQKAHEAAEEREKFLRENLR